MAGILVKGSKSYDFERIVRGSSFIRLYDNKGFCFRSFLDITSEGFKDYAVFKLTTDTEENTDKTYYIREGTLGNYSFSVGEYSENAYELIPTNEYELAKVEGIGTVTAKLTSIENKKGTLVLPVGIYPQTGLIINFRTTVNNNDLNSIIIDDSKYELIDSAGVNISNCSFAFTAGNIVSIIIDVETKRAIVENLSFNSSNVEFTQAITSGNKIGTLTINGIDTDLYSTKYSEVNYNESGLMSKEDKVKLDDALIKSSDEDNNINGNIVLPVTKGIFTKKDDGNSPLISDNGNIWVGSNGNGKKSTHHKGNVYISTGIGSNNKGYETIKVVSPSINEETGEVSCTTGNVFHTNYIPSIEYGGTGAKNRNEALANLNGFESFIDGTPQHIPLIYANLEETGLVTESSTTEEVAKALPNNSSIIFSHNNTDPKIKIRLTDAPYSFGTCFLISNSTNYYGWFIASNNDVYCYSGSNLNGWIRLNSIYLTLGSTGLVTESSTTKDVIHKMRDCSSITFSHKEVPDEYVLTDRIRLTDAPAYIGICTLIRSREKTFADGWFIASDGEVYIYRYDEDKWIKLINESNLLSSISTNLIRGSLGSTGLVTESSTTEEVAKKMLNYSKIMFDHNYNPTATSSDEIYLTDAPYHYGVCTLTRGRNENYINGWFMACSGEVYRYKYSKDINTYNGWVKVSPNPDIYKNLEETGLVQAGDSDPDTLTIAKKLNMHSRITFEHNSTVANNEIKLSDAPSTYGVCTLYRGRIAKNGDTIIDNYINGWFMATNGDLYKYKYSDESGTKRNGWTKVLSDFEYGEELPTEEAEHRPGRVFFKKVKS